MSASRSTKRPTRAKDPQEKLDAISRVTSGESKASVARSIDVPESTLRGWCKNTDKIKAAVAAAKSSKNTIPRPVCSPNYSSASTSSSNKRFKLDESGRNSSPELSDLNDQAPIDLSRTSPLRDNNMMISPSRDNGMAINPHQQYDYIRAARIMQQLQQARGSIPLLTTRQQPTLPNESIPTEESIRQWLNKSVNPINGQNSSTASTAATTATLEQNNLYMQWYNNFIHSGLPNPLNMSLDSAANNIQIYNQLMQNNTAIAATYPTARRPVAVAVPSQPREASDVAETHRSNQARNPGSPNTCGQLVSSSTNRTSSSPIPAVLTSTPVCAKGLSPNRTVVSPSVNGESANASSTSSSSDCTSPTSTSSTLDLSKDSTPKIEPEEVKIENVKTEPEDEKMEIAVKTEKEEIKTEAKEPRKTKESVDNMLSILNQNVDKSDEENDSISFEDVIAMGQSFQKALEKLSPHPAVTGLYLYQIRTMLASMTKKAETAAMKKRKCDEM